MPEGDPIIVPNVETPATQEGGATSAQAQMPAFDPSALTQTINESLRSGFETLAQQMTQQYAPVTPQVPAQQPDPLAGTLSPYLTPVQLQAQAATDAAVFYATNDEAKGYAAKIEELANSYPGTPRAKIWQFIRGSDEYINAAVQKRLDDQKRAAELAAQGSALGVGSPQHQAYNGPVRQAADMPHDELLKALDGYSF